jgi:hypothetical protein
VKESVKKFAVLKKVAKKIAVGVVKELAKKLHKPNICRIF